MKETKNPEPTEDRRRAGHWSKQLVRPQRKTLLSLRLGTFLRDSVTGGGSVHPQVQSHVHRHTHTHTHTHVEREGGGGMLGTLWEYLSTDLGGGGNWVGIAYVHGDQIMSSSEACLPC